MSEEDGLWENKEKAQSIFKEKRKLENLLKDQKFLELSRQIFKKSRKIPDIFWNFLRTFQKSGFRSLESEI